MTSQDNPLGFSTRVTHLANVPGLSAVPIYMGAVNDGEYTRDRNPTLDVLADALTDLEGGAATVLSATGMAAITQTLMTLLHTGGRLIRHQTIYASTLALLGTVLERFGVETEAVDLRDLGALDDALADGAGVVYGETISNPNIEVIDIAAVAERAHAAGATFVIDNTFATPYFCRPLERGADVVIHSASKYLCGHGDALGGAIVFRDETLAERTWDLMTLHGGSLSPFNAALILRGLKTLPLRMDAHAANAMKLAAFFESHPRVAGVRYPGLVGNGEHERALRQLSGFGGMVGVDIDADQAATEAFADRLRVAKRAPSLGDVHTLVTITRAWEPLGIAGSYARVSVGLEDSDDLIADFDRCLREI